MLLSVNFGIHLSIWSLAHGLWQAVCRKLLGKWIVLITCYVNFTYEIFYYHTGLFDCENYNVKKKLAWKSNLSWNCHPNDKRDTPAVMHSCSEALLKWIYTFLYVFHQVTDLNLLLLYFSSYRRCSHHKQKQFGFKKKRPMHINFHFINLCCVHVKMK